MHRYLSVDIICLKRGTVFQGWGSRKSVPFKECKMSKDKYGRLISSHMEAVVVIILQIILLKCLQMSYCLLHLLFTFQCCPVGLYEQKKHVSFFCNNPKMAPYLEYDFKGRLIVVDIKFWKLGNITLGVYSLIFPSFCGDVFSWIML